jgi:tetratricopeptide (TPR) repeat protein
VLAALLLASSSGCGHYGEHPKCPPEGGSPWLEVASDHFTVVSDLPREEALSTARGLEESLDALTQISFEHPRIPVERTTVVIFRSGSDYHAFRPEQTAGTFYKRLPNDPEASRFVVVYDSLTPETRKPFIHELTHDLIERNIGAAPPWLNEGWAEYYSTLRVVDGKVVIGESPRALTFTDERAYSTVQDGRGGWVLAIPIDQVPPPSSLMKMPASEFYRSVLTEHANNDDDLRGETLYAAAWAFVHMLVDGPSAYQRRLAAFLRSSVSGKSVEDALRDGFGDLPPEQLDRDFRKYLGAGEIAVWQLRYQPPAKPFAFSVRALPDYELHLYWARLTKWTGPSAATARRDLDAARAAEPFSPEPRYYRGLFEMAQDDLPAAKTELAAALAADPNEPRYLLGLLYLLRKEAEVASSPDKVREVATLAARLGSTARTATELNAAADTLNHLGRPDAGLALAQRAAKLAPYDADVLDTYANALFELGRVAEAIDIQTAAVSFMDEDERDAGIVQRLELYKSKAE